MTLESLAGQTGENFSSDQTAQSPIPPPTSAGKSRRHDTMHAIAAEGAQDGSKMELAEEW